jgi:prohibitin 1
MEKLNKIGLPIVIIVMFTFIMLVKSVVNIGYGEAGVLFKTLGGGVVTDQQPMGEGLTLYFLGIKYMYTM